MKEAEGFPFSINIFPVMYYVYALYSQTFDKIYIGYTSDLTGRLYAHNNLPSCSYTKRYRPWDIVYSEQIEEKSEAMIREKQLKSAKGREFIWNKIRQT